MSGATSLRDAALAQGDAIVARRPGVFRARPAARAATIGIIAVLLGAYVAGFVLLDIN